MRIYAIDCPEWLIDCSKGIRDLDKVMRELIDVAADMNAHEMSLEDIHGRLVAGEEIVSSALPPSNR